MAFGWAECQFRRTMKRRDENYYERLYNRRKAKLQMQQQNVFQRRLGSQYSASKFPILPPRLKIMANIYERGVREKRAHNERKDDIDLSSTNLSPVAWELPRKQYNRILERETPTVVTTQPPPEKLMRPKPTRPPAYSLDGFVPKPSNIEIVVHQQSTPKKLQSNGKSVWSDVPFIFGKPKREGKPKLDKKDFNGKEKALSARRRSNKNGIAGRDYPVYVHIPETNFSCEHRRIAGMYADPEAGCQVWHICTGVSHMTRARHSFLCAAGTIFNDKKGVCDWWYNVACS